MDFPPQWSNANMAVFRRSEELGEAIFAVVIPAILQVRSLGSSTAATSCGSGAGSTGGPVMR